MNRNWQPDTRGVSEVVGNVLLVGIVVILAALIGPFAYDMAKNAQEVAPAGVFDFETSANGEVVIVYEQGPDLDTDRLLLAGTDPDGTVTFGPWPTDGSLTPGDSVTLAGSDGDEDIRIAWVTGDDRTLPLAENRQ